jgi:hypothetical protein
MTDDDYVRLERFFDEYVGRFRADDGRLPPMLQLKLDHTRHVVANAETIMDAEGWPSARRRLGHASALLHDVGRFPQLTVYGTFDDHRSVNHAACGCETLVHEGALTHLPHADRAAILAAVRHHNAKHLPLDLGADTTTLTHLVRDADKLDIFRVFENAVTSGDLDSNPEIAWNLDVAGPPSDTVLARVEAGESVDYREVRTLCDFVLIQISWIQSQLHFRSTLRLALERDALGFRTRLLLARHDTARLRAVLEHVRRAVNPTEQTG